MTLASLVYMDTLLWRELDSRRHDFDVWDNKKRVYEQLAYTRELTEAEAVEYEHCLEKVSFMSSMLKEARTAYDEFSSKDWA